MRRGLSYLEVLIAAGIALTGILGAVALFPVAILNMQKGQTVDTMAAIGPSVLESVGILHLDDPEHWLFSIAGNRTEFENDAYPSRPDFQGRHVHPLIQPWEAFCFDPRFVASVATFNAAQSDPTVFPAIPAASGLDVRMRRLSLWSGAAGSPKPAMATAQARKLFKIQDDLIFAKPDDETSPAQQSYLNNGADLRRDYFADFEFVITAAPFTNLAVRPDLVGLPYDPANVVFQATGEYELSAVIFRGRQPDLSEVVIANGDPSVTEEERLCDLTFLTPGYNGGDVTITLRAGRPASDLAIVDTSWVLVSGVETVTFNPPLPNPPTSKQRPVFHWYKVASFSEVYGTSRDLTLEGPDWPANTSNIRCTLASGVVGVFHKPLHLHK